MHGELVGTMSFTFVVQGVANHTAVHIRKAPSMLLMPTDVCSSCMSWVSPLG